MNARYTYALALLILSLPLSGYDESQVIPIPFNPCEEEPTFTSIPVEPPVEEEPPFEEEPLVYPEPISAPIVLVPLESPLAHQPTAIKYVKKPSLDLCRYFYVGMEGSWSQGFATASNSHHNGQFFHGDSYYARTGSGYGLGASVGYRFNTLLRTDISYTFLRNPYRWTANFVGLGVDNFKAHLISQMVLANIYLHTNAFIQLIPGFDPYITAGLGLASNHLYQIREYFSGDGTFLAKIKSHVSNNLAVRTGIGVFKSLGKGWIADLGFNANYIGLVSSDNTRKTLPPDFIPGGVQPIGPYKFYHNWTGALYFSIKRTF